MTAAVSIVLPACSSINAMRNLEYTGAAGKVSASQEFRGTRILSNSAPLFIGAREPTRGLFDHVPYMEMQRKS